MTTASTHSVSPAAMGAQHVPALIAGTAPSALAAVERRLHVCCPLAPVRLAIGITVQVRYCFITFIIIILWKTV
jgi:hypothetical protein